MKKRTLLKLLPVFIIYIIIFRFLYLNNGFTTILQVCIPVFLGLFIAVLLNPILIFIEVKLKINNRSLGILITYLLFFSLITLIIIVITPSIVQSLWNFIKDIPKLFTTANNYILNLSEKYKLYNNSDVFYSIIENSLITYSQKLTVTLTSFLNLAIGKVINIFSALWNLILAMIISVYILLDKENFENWFYKLCHSLFESKYATEIVNLGYSLNKNVTRFISGKLLDSLIIGLIAYFVSEYIIKAPYPLIIGVIIGITNMIPYFGPFIGGIPATIITLLVDPSKGFLMGIFILILQQFDGLLLGPKILGIQLSIKPILIIISVIIGGGLFGPIGMFIATPIVALLKTSIDTYMNIQLKNKKIHLPHDNTK